MLKVVQQLFGQMNEKIKYVHFKSNEHLSEGLSGKTDLDLLIVEHDRDKLIKILNKLCFVPVTSPKEQEYEGVEHWLGFDDDSGNLIHLHIYYKLITGKSYIKEVILNWSETAYETSIFYLDEEEKICIVNPEFELVLLLTRIFCKASLRERILYDINFNNCISKDVVREYEFLRRKVSNEKLGIMLKMMFTQIDDMKISCIFKYLSKNDLEELYICMKELIIVEAGCGSQIFTYRGN